VYKNTINNLFYNTIVNIKQILFIYQILIIEKQNKHKENG